MRCPECGSSYIYKLSFKTTVGSISIYRLSVEQVHLGVGDLPEILTGYYCSSCESLVSHVYTD